MTDMRQFVAAHRAEWERLESLLDRAARNGLPSLPADDLRDMGVLHRKASAHLAMVRTVHAESRIVDFLNGLVLRSHNAVYRAPRKPLLRRLSDFLRDVPRVVRSHPGALAASVILFASGGLLGAFGTALDHRIAVMLLGSEFVERVRAGEYWIESLFDVVPHSVASAGILTNNLSVAITVFALGITGVFSAMVLFLNGLMLGAVLVLCGQYGLMSRFVPFVVTHGAIEISAILLAGAAGFMIFDGWLHPGDRTRLDGLRRGARHGLQVLGAAAAALLVAGPVEGLISPQEGVPGFLRITLGVTLALLFWGWLLGYRGREPEATADPDV